VISIDNVANGQMELALLDTHWEREKNTVVIIFFDVSVDGEDVNLLCYGVL